MYFAIINLVCRFKYTKTEANDSYIDGQGKSQNKTSHGDSEDLVPGLLSHSL